MAYTEIVAFIHCTKCNSRLPWTLEFFAKSRTYRQNRRALEQGGGGKISVRDLESIKEAQNGICFYCEAAPIQEFDHFIPLVAGGAHDAANLRGSCLPCNRAKSAKMPWDWMPERFSGP